MDVTSIRTRNVAMLVTLHGGPTSFGKLVDRDQVQVSQWTSESKPKPIGGRLARHLETRLGHPKGWLDAPQWNGHETPPVQRSQSVTLEAETLAETIKALRERNAKRDWLTFMEKEPERFIRAYMLYAEKTADELSPEEQRKLGMKLADLTPQGAIENEREQEVPAKGTIERRVGHRRGSKAPA